MSDKKILADNRKAFFNYEISDKFEAGIVLKGCEVKAIRLGKANLRDSYALIKNDELWLFNCHISAYEEANRLNEEPLRTRKLLLHRAQIKKLIGKTQEKGLVLIPLNIYLINQKVKVELGLGKSKKLFDKRRDLKEKAILKDLKQKS